MDQKTILTALAIVAVFIYLRWRRMMRRSHPKALASALANGALVLDVRSKEEFDQGHYPGARNIPLENLSGEVTSLQARPDQPVIIYCQSGMRAAMARRLLQEAGYTQVLNAGSLGNLPPVKNE